MPKVERNTDKEPSKAVLRDSQQTKSLGELAVIVYNKTYLEALPASKWNLASRYNSTCWQFQFLKLQASWTCCGRYFLDDCWLVASSQDWVKYELITISARCSCHSLSNFISFLPQASWALTHELLFIFLNSHACFQCKWREKSLHETNFRYLRHWNLRTKKFLSKDFVTYLTFHDKKTTTLEPKCKLK